MYKQEQLLHNELVINSKLLLDLRKESLSHCHIGHKKSILHILRRIEALISACINITRQMIFQLTALSTIGRVYFRLFINIPLMDRISNFIFCILSLAGIITGFVLLVQGSQPCGSDGCLIHILLFVALIFLSISVPIFYVTLKREIAWREKNKKVQ